MKKPKLGATGRFPRGKLTAHDEGELSFAIGAVKGEVVLQFGKPIAWLGMPPWQAIELGKALISAGERAEKGKARHEQQKDPDV